MLDTVIYFLIGVNSPEVFRKEHWNGPTIFLALSNDAAIMKDGNQMALKYVDDLTLVENISVSQQSNIQCDLDSFDQWATENHMNLNTAKCMFMYITFVKEPPVLPPLRLVGRICRVRRFFFFFNLGDQNNKRPTVGRSHF